MTEDKPNPIINDPYYDTMKKLVYEMPHTYATILSTFPEGRKAIEKEYESHRLDIKIRSRELEDKAEIEEERR